MNPDHVEQLLAFLRFPSISTDPAHAPDVPACAGWLAGRLEAIGLNAVVHPTAGHPIVVARTEHVPGRRTVMIYGHYDVQPVDPLELWQTPPFEPRIEDTVVFARGAADNKGQIFAHVTGIDLAEKPLKVAALHKLLTEHGAMAYTTIILANASEPAPLQYLAPYTGCAMAEYWRDRGGHES
jgi:acetylornithine deacetylase/succinyl-diaminopimelate desuccinylase-like protein